MYFLCKSHGKHWASQVELVVKDLPAKAGDIRDMSSIPGSGRYPGVGNDNPLHYSCLQNLMDRGAWWAIQSMGSQRVGHKLKRLSTHPQ